MVLHQPRKPGQNSRSLVVIHVLSRLIVSLTQRSFPHLFNSKTRLHFVPYQINCMRNSICSNIFRMTSRAIEIRASFHRTDTLLYLVLSVLLSLVLQRVTIGSGLQENFDGPETATGVTAAIALPPGLELLRVIPQRGIYGLPESEETWQIGSIEAGSGATLVLQARTLQRGMSLVDFQVMSYEQADLDSDPGNNLLDEDDQTQLMVTVPQYSKRMFLASSPEAAAPSQAQRTQSQPFSRGGRFAR